MIAFLITYWKYVAMAALAALLAIQTARIDGLKADAAELLAAQQAQHIAAMEIQRAEEARRVEAVNEQALQAQEKVNELETTVAAANDSAGRLRQRIAALTRQARSNPTPAAAGKGEQGADALDLLAGVLTRLDDGAGQIAEYADRVAIAGATCERTYDAVKDGAK